jgi:hypothetical protein
MSPARSAVLRNVLVSSEREVVSTVYVSPVPSSREVLRANVLKRLRRLDMLLVALLYEARLVFSKESLLLLLCFTSSFRRLILSAVSPSINGDSKSAGFFDTKMVDASEDLEVASVTPVGTPGVSNPPVFGTVFDTPADDRDGVIDFVGGGINMDDTTRVVEDVRSIDTAGDGSSLVELIHDGHLIVSNRAVLTDGVGVPSVRNGASFTRITVFAKDIFAAFKTVGVATSLIRRAGFVSNTILVDVVVCSERVTTIATEIRVLTRDENLRSKVNVRPSTLSHDLNTIRESRCSSEGPARAAIVRNVLVSTHSEVVGSIDITPEEVLRKVVDVNSGEVSLDEGGRVRVTDEARGTSLVGSEGEA